MKYENYNSVSLLCKAIERCEKELYELASGGITIEINTACGRFGKISVNETSSDNYYPQATILVEAIKHDLQSRVDKYKADLLQL